MGSKPKIIGIIIAIGIALIAIFNNGLYSKTHDPIKTENIQANPTQTQNEDPKIVSTSPDPIDGAVITPNQSIILTFNYPLENQGELKLKFDPKVDVKIELSQDRKTAKITPTQSFQVGYSYNVTIGPDTKFDGKRTLGHDINFNLKTVSYNGV